MSKKILIAGRTGTGKDTIADLLAGRGLTRVYSYTTRPKRSEDENTHVFITPEVAKAIPDKIGYTMLNGCEYFTTVEQIQRADIYIVDPAGVQDVCHKMPDTEFMLVYMTSMSGQETMQKAIARATDTKAEAIVYAKRTEEEASAFDELEVMIDKRQLPENVTTSFVVVNLYEMSSLTKAVDSIMETFQEGNANG